MRRKVFVGVVVVAILFLISVVGPWLFLSSWVPTKGKAWLIQELERQGAVKVSIGQMRYHPLKGLALGEVRLVERTREELWCAIPAMHLRMSWLSFLLQRQLAFHGRADLETPCRSVLTFTGRYSLRDQSLILDAQSTEIPLSSVTAPLKPYVPPSLTDGIVRLELHLTQPPRTLPTITGHVVGRKLVWDAPPWHLRGDLTLDGAASPPSSVGDHWSLQAMASLRRATLEGMPVVGPIKQLEGTARVSPEQINVEELTGTALGFPVRLEGMVTLRPTPSLDVLVQARTDLAPLAEALSQVHPHTTEVGAVVQDTWKPAGRADVRAVCRGVLQPSLVLDCLTHADLRDVTLTGPKLSHPLTGMTGSASYDLVEQRLSIERLTGRLMDEPFTISGAVRVAHPMRLALHVIGTLPLETVMLWLPTESPLTRLGGLAALDLTINGPTSAPQYSGHAELRDATVRFTNPAITLERVMGSVVLTPDRIDIPQATLRLNDQPLTLKATITPSEVPRLVATVGFPHGELALVSRMTPEAVWIDAGQLSLPKSRVQLRGTVGRGVDRLSTLSLSGAIELSELTTLPLVRLPALEEWRLQGVADVEATFQGRLSDWPGAAMQSRIRAERLSVRELPLEQFQCTIEQRDRVLRVRVPSTLVAEGTLSGELTVEHHPQSHDSLLQADLVGLQLAKLMQAVPAWRSRSMSGSASAHAMFSGTWEQRPTWIGEGWFNASGERLGDVPLLDKLFRGLFGVLADRLALESLRRAQMTQASCRWRLSKERVGTEDLRLGGLAGTEPVAVYAKGSVGLDRTLDFIIEPELSEGVVLEAPTTSTLARTILKAAGQLERLRRLIGRHRLTGTLDKPEYRFEFSPQEIFKQLGPAPADFLQNLLDAVR